MCDKCRLQTCRLALGLAKLELLLAKLALLLAKIALRLDCLGLMVQVTRYIICQSAVCICRTPSLGYRLTESSYDRAGRTIGKNIRRFKRRVETITNGKKKKQFRSEKWINITINPEEIEQSPTDTLDFVPRLRPRIHGFIQSLRSLVFAIKSRR